MFEASGEVPMQKALTTQRPEHVKYRMDEKHFRDLFALLIHRKQLTEKDAANLMACVYFWNEAMRK